MMAPAALAPVPEVGFANRYRGSAGAVPHQHPGTEFVLVLRGSCRITVAGTILAGGPGDLFILPPKIVHDQVDEGEVETLYVDLVIPPRHFDDRPRVIPVGLDGWAATWLAEMVTIERQRQPAGLRKGLALSFLTYLTLLEQRAESRRALHPAVAIALQRMEDDLLEDLSVADLARAAEVSASHLTALFRDHLGCAPMAWRQKQRLDFACRQLGNVYLSIAEVAASCGYPDTNYFARLFRQVHGCSPTTWRKRLSKD